MDDALLYGQGMSFPPRVGPDGRMAWSSGPENIRESIRVLLLTERSERLQLPQYGGGIREFLHLPNTVEIRRLIRNRIGEAIGRWEPRVRLETIQVDVDPADASAAVALIRYRLIATQSEQQLAMRFELEQ